MTPSGPLLAAIAAVATLAAAVANAAESAPQLRHDGGVAYVEGNDGAAERIAPDTNLRLVFEDARNGSPLDDIALAVTDFRGETVLGLHSVDALLRARLEPGRYRVAATLHGIELVRDVEVPAVGERVEVFRWRDPLPGLR